MATSTEAHNGTSVSNGPANGTSMENGAGMQMSGFPIVRARTSSRDMDVSLVEI